MAQYTWNEKLKKYVSADWQIMGWGTAYKQSDWSWGLKKPTTKVDAAWVKAAPTKTEKSNNVADIYPYTKLTWDTPAKSSSRGNASDLSYMQPTSYHSSWKPWDKTIDISKDPDRAKQMAYNIKQDMIANPKLFTNRDDFNKYYEYDKSSPSQKKLLDAAFANANKYGLWATDNFYADMASQASDDKNKLLMNKAADTYNKLLPELNDIRNKLNDRLGPVFDRLMDSQTKYLKDMAYLRKLQMQHYKGMTEEANNRAAWRSVSMWSILSWQWLSSSAIASSSLWVEKNWVEELNSNMEEHIKTMKELADAEGDFTNNWAGVVGNLTTQEQNALKTWYDNFKTLQDGLDDTYNTMIKERYSPYEVMTQARVSWAAETLQSTWKSDVKQSEYQWANSTKKRSIIYNQLYWLLSSNPELFAKFTPYITTAVEQYPNDWEKAVTTVLAKGWVKNTQPVIDKLNETTDWSKPGSITEALGL